MGGHAGNRLDPSLNQHLDLPASEASGRDCHINRRNLTDRIFVIQRPAGPQRKEQPHQSVDPEKKECSDRACNPKRRCHPQAGSCSHGTGPSETEEKPRDGSHRKNTELIRVVHGPIGKIMVVDAEQCEENLNDQDNPCDDPVLGAAIQSHAGWRDLLAEGRMPAGTGLAQVQAALLTAAAAVRVERAPALGLSALAGDPTGLARALRQRRNGFQPEKRSMR